MPTPDKSKPTYTPQPIMLARVAQELHRHFRAACKALGVPSKHDHGWAGCHKQSYFIRRAGELLKTENDFIGQYLRNVVVCDFCLIPVLPNGRCPACGGKPKNLFGFEDGGFIANNAPRDEAPLTMPSLIAMLRNFHNTLADWLCSENHPCDACKVVRAASKPKPVETTNIPKIELGPRRSFYIHGDFPSVQTSKKEL